MAIQKIITGNHPVLRQKSEKLTSSDDCKSHLIDLLDTLASVGDLGVGLSANQIAVSKQIFIARIYPGNEAKETLQPEPRHFVNPEILWTSEETNIIVDPEKRMLEGCLSLPNIYAFVERPYRVKIRFHTVETLNQNNQPLEEEFVHDNAVVVLHEIDHLNGILFTDRAITQESKIYEIANGQEPRIIEI